MQRGGLGSDQWTAVDKNKTTGFEKQNNIGGYPTVFYLSPLERVGLFPFSPLVVCIRRQKWGVKEGYGKATGVIVIAPPQRSMFVILCNKFIIKNMTSRVNQSLV